MGASLGSRVGTGLALSEAVPQGLGDAEAVLRDSVGAALAELLPRLKDSRGDALGELLPVLNDSLGDLLGVRLPIWVSDHLEVCDTLGELLAVGWPHAGGSSSSSSTASKRFIAAEAPL